MKTPLASPNSESVKSHVNDYYTSNNIQVWKRISKWRKCYVLKVKYIYWVYIYTIWCNKSKIAKTTFVINTLNRRFFLKLFWLCIIRRSKLYDVSTCSSLTKIVICFTLLKIYFHLKTRFQRFLKENPPFYPHFTLSVLILNYCL